MRVEVVKPYELAELSLASPSDSLNVTIHEDENSNTRRLKITPTSIEQPGAMAKLNLIVKLKTGETLQRVIHVRLPDKTEAKTASAVAP